MCSCYKFVTSTAARLCEIQNWLVSKGDAEKEIFTLHLGLIVLKINLYKNKVATPRLCIYLRR